MTTKTHKGIKKRIKKTKKGKLLHWRTGKNHLMLHKSGKKSSKLGNTRELSSADKKVLERQYGVS